MPQVEVELVANAPLDKVYGIAKEIERFPDWMPDVESITVLSRQGGTVTSRWVGVVQEFKRKIRWTEEDTWDDSQRKVVFRATEGDWDVYEGEWSFFPEEDKTRMHMRLNYEFNVPLIGPLIKGILKKLIEKNSRQMLQALARQAEKK
jgi:ribosome-associated toxin RatA of RatAB toxin-antitoxin module